MFCLSLDELSLNMSNSTAVVAIAAKDVKKSNRNLFTHKSERLSNSFNASAGISSDLRVRQDSALAGIALTEEEDSPISVWTETKIVLQT